MCKLFGHDLRFNCLYNIHPYCRRCGLQVRWLDIWLDKHMD
ncbi:DUF1660 domain-containing protein [Lactococcus kimchii]